MYFSNFLLCDGIVRYLQYLLFVPFDFVKSFIAITSTECRGYVINHVPVFGCLLVCLSICLSE